MIQVGQVLDKYELLERVGQGGMAIVYRGIDRQLKRTVAVKILHRHLSDYQEARDRFEREAQAVASLRHENILEIFDYSAKEGSESYIVTEFIDGQTLKQFVTDRPIAFPEIGAMIILQVCRALAHAHAGSILHRDVKPENIMIRHDGIVKLMDFGISHMVDLERLTVTGQLLGSPAYMAPEHVEGRPLDFRTDVFAAGIVLYQLCVGKLPFEGKNPHEVLKRIAECRFLDPRQANPRIGNRLGRIILKAMAAAPNDRYPAIGEMVLAIEAYLEESGLPSDKIPAELARYFQAPASYEAALKARLVDTLTRTGKQKLEGDDRAGALDVFDRVLTIDPENAVVLAMLDKLNRRARMRTVALGVLGVMVLGFGAYMIHERSKTTPPDPPTLQIDPSGSGAQQQNNHVTQESPPPDAPVKVPVDAPPQVAVTPHDAQPMVTHPVLDAGETVVTPTDGQLEPVPIAISGVLGGSTYRVGTDPPQAVTNGTFTVSVTEPVVITITNAKCAPLAVTLDRTMKSYTARQEFSTANLKLHCPAPKGVDPKDWKVLVSVDSVSWSFERPFIVAFEAMTSMPSKNLVVVFSGGRSSASKVDQQTVTIGPAETQDVTCALR